MATNSIENVFTQPILLRFIEDENRTNQSNSTPLENTGNANPDLGQSSNVNRMMIKPL